MDVISPHGPEDLIHGKTGKHFPESAVSLDVEQDGEVLLFPPVVQETTVADFLETGRKYMHHETADEFLTGNGDLVCFSCPVVLCKESDLFRCNAEDPGICDGDAVRVASKVFDGVAVPVKGLLQLDVPLRAVHLILKDRPGITVPEPGAGTGKRKFSFFVIPVKECEEFPTEFFHQRENGKKETTLTKLQLFCLCQSAAGNDAVDMRVVIQFLSPGVEYLDDPGCCSEILWIL